ncbi:MFS transporter [Streptomyces sp. NPDC015414]|uniref:MFS transporter n=1 Tax=Streptomyces sp. NPDC015414 TaxID=3364957 RepID=UPI0036F63E7D
MRVATAHPTPVPRLRWVRIVGTAFAMYTVAFMDRINFGFGIEGVRKDLGISAGEAGFAGGGAFFLGYVLLQIPGGKIAERWGARRLVLVAGVAWGAIAMSTGLVQNFTQLLVVRFLLGLSEGAVYPAMMVLLSRWFPQRERGRAISYFILCVPFGQAVISPVSGLILKYGSWRELFVIEGFLPILLGVAWWLLIADRPADARWLSAAERDYITTAQAAEATAEQRPADVLRALGNRNVQLMIATYVFLQMGQYGFGLWLPTVVKTVSGGSDLTVGLLTALPWIAGMIGLVVNGRHSDRTGERKVHVAVPVAIGSVFLVISTLLGTGRPVLALISLVCAIGFFQSYNGVVWVIPSQLVGSTALGPVAGLINGLGTLAGGFAGPYLVGYLSDTTGTVLTGQYVLAAALLLSAATVLAVRIRRADAPEYPAPKSADHRDGSKV